MEQGVKIDFLSRLRPKPNRSPAKRVRFGKEEQRNERALTFEKVGASDMQLAPTWSKRSKSIFLSETNHDSLQVSNWGTDEKQVNTFLFKNHLQNRYIGEFLNSLNCFSDKEPKSFCASSCSSSRRKAHISRKLSDVLDIIACNSDFS